MLRRKVPIWFALPLVFGLASVLYAVDNSASENSTQVTAKVWSEEECLKCHTDKKTLLKMQSKRGDNTYCQATFEAMTHQNSTKPSASAYKTETWK